MPNVWPYTKLYACKPRRLPRSYEPKYDPAHANDGVKALKLWGVLDEKYKAAKGKREAASNAEIYADAVAAVAETDATIAKVESVLRTAGNVGMRLPDLMYQAFGITWGDVKGQPFDSLWTAEEKASYALVLAAVRSGRILRGTKEHGKSETYFARGL